jgi:hypothetical protein
VGARAAWCGWAVWSAGPAQSGRSFLAFFVYSFKFSFICKAFLAPKIIRKLQIKYLRIPCEKGFKMEPLLK